MKKLWPLFSVIVVDLIGFGVVMPILPFYAEHYGASATVLGLLLASYAAMQFVFAPIWGQLSDRIGRRPVLMITVFAGGLSFVVLGLANSLLWIFIGRILSGIFAANISVATAYVSDVTDEQHRASGMGLIGAAFGIGFVLGPALGGFLTPYGLAVPILVAAALNGINVIQVWRRLPEPQRHVAVEAERFRAKVMSIPKVRVLVVLNFLFVFGVSQLEAIFAFFVMDRYGYDTTKFALLLVFSAIIMVLVQGGLVRRLKGVADYRLLLFGALPLALAIGFMGELSTLWPLLVVLAISSIGRGIAQPAMLSIVSKGASPKNRGAVLGTYQSAASLARVFAPAMAGLLYDWHLELPFWIGGGLLFVVWLWALAARSIIHAGMASEA